VACQLELKVSQVLCLRASRRTLLRSPLPRRLSSPASRVAVLYASLPSIASISRSFIAVILSINS